MSLSRLFLQLILQKQHLKNINFILFLLGIIFLWPLHWYGKEKQGRFSNSSSITCYPLVDKTVMFRGLVEVPRYLWENPRRWSWFPTFLVTKCFPGKPCTPHGVLSGITQEQREVSRDHVRKCLFLMAYTRSYWKHKPRAGETRAGKTWSREPQDHRQPQGMWSAAACVG